VPIPGTRRSERAGENVGADATGLSAGQLNRLNDVEPPVGDRYADMTPIKPLTCLGDGQCALS
jgi:diketogulonate reductase-like aldo/keto reductase